MVNMNDKRRCKMQLSTGEYWPNTETVMTTCNRTFLTSVLEYYDSTNRYVISIWCNKSLNKYWQSERSGFGCNICECVWWFQGEDCHITAMLNPFPQYGLCSNEQLYLSKWCWVSHVHERQKYIITYLVATGTREEIDIVQFQWFHA